MIGIEEYQFKVLSFKRLYQIFIVSNHFSLNVCRITRGGQGKLRLEITCQAVYINNPALKND